MAEGPGQRVQRRVGAMVRDKYRIDAFIATGSMANVYAATHRNGSRVALKILHGDLARDAAMVERFRREGYFANAIGHPGVVRAIDDDLTEDGCAFIVLQLLEGENLEERRKRVGGRIPVGEALQIGDAMLEILAAAHGHEVLHRDVKPENVFITHKNEIKLLDFGVARFNDGRSSSEMTGVGMVLGTPAFMPPEQALGKREEVDARSDIWGVGATLFTVISGESVHPGGNAKMKLIATARKPVRPLSEAAPTAPRAVCAVIDRALAFDKAQRWNDAKAMREALRWARMSLEGETGDGGMNGLAENQEGRDSSIAPVPTRPAPERRGGSRPDDFRPRLDSAPSSEEATRLNVQNVYEADVATTTHARRDDYEAQEAERIRKTSSMPPRPAIRRRRSTTDGLYTSAPPLTQREAPPVMSSSEDPTFSLRNEPVFSLRDPRPAFGGSAAPVDRSLQSREKREGINETERTPRKISDRPAAPLGGMPTPIAPPDMHAMAGPFGHGVDPGPQAMVETQQALGSPNARDAREERLGRDRERDRDRSPQHLYETMPAATGAAEIFRAALARAQSETKESLEPTTLPRRSRPDRAPIVEPDPDLERTRAREPESRPPPRPAAGMPPDEIIPKPESSRPIRTTPGVGPSGPGGLSGMAQGTAPTAFGPTGPPPPVQNMGSPGPAAPAFKRVDATQPMPAQGGFGYAPTGPSGAYEYGNGPSMPVGPTGPPPQQHPSFPPTYGGPGGGYGSAYGASGQYPSETPPPYGQGGHSSDAPPYAPYPQPPHGASDHPTSMSGAHGYAGGGADPYGASMSGSYGGAHPSDAPSGFEPRPSLPTENPGPLLSQIVPKKKNRAARVILPVFFGMLLGVVAYIFYMRRQAEAARAHPATQATAAPSGSAASATSAPSGSASLADAGVLTDGGPSALAAGGDAGAPSASASSSATAATSAPPRPRRRPRPRPQPPTTATTTTTTELPDPAPTTTTAPTTTSTSGASGPSTAPTTTSAPTTTMTSTAPAPAPTPQDSLPRKEE